VTALRRSPLVMNTPSRLALACALWSSVGCSGQIAETPEDARARITPEGVSLPNTTATRSDAPVTPVVPPASVPALPRADAPAARVAAAIESGDAGAERDAGGQLRGDAGDAGGAPNDAGALLSLEQHCERDAECASGFCRAVYEQCADPSLFPLPSGSSCATDGDCASLRCVALYPDPDRWVAHNCQ
jgi:hypothetical protein